MVYLFISVLIFFWKINCRSPCFYC